MKRFSRGEKIKDNLLVVEEVASEEYYSIIRLDQDNYGLFVEDGLFDMWMQSGVVDVDFLNRKFCQFREGYLFLGRPQYCFFGVKSGPYAETMEDILNFCVALNDLHTSIKGIVYADLIYIEEYDLLLPVMGEPVGKDVAVGMFLTEGIPVSGRNVDNLCVINQWLNRDGIIHALNAAGINMEGTHGYKKADGPVAKSKDSKIPSGRFNLPGRMELTQYFNEQIVDFVQNREKYEKLGINTIPATLLYGKPGCGKTYAVEKLAEFLGLPCFEIKSESVASPYIHDTSKKIAEVFNRAIDVAPSILIIDEMEAYVSKRDGYSSGGHHIEEVGEFLRGIPKAIDSQVIIFGMTNMIDEIDPAILRKGRFDFIKEVGMPSKEEVEEVVTHALLGVKCSENINTEEIADRLTDRPLADVAYVIRQAGRIAVQRNLDEITEECILVAVDGLVGKQEEMKDNSRHIGFI